MAHDAILASCIHQTFYVNKKQQPEGMSADNQITLQTEDLAYLPMRNLNMLKGCAYKLLPKYLGPYKIVSAQPDISVYELDLPQELYKQGIYC